MQQTSTRPLVPVHTLTTDALLVQLGLSRAWTQALEAELAANEIPQAKLGWDVDAVAGWRRRVLTDGDLLTLHEYRLVAMRLASFPPIVIRERAHGRTDNATFHRLGLIVALRYTHDHLRVRPRRAGHRLITNGPGWRGEPPHVIRRR